jgi:hypothetical protein
MEHDGKSKSRSYLTGVSWLYASLWTGVGPSTNERFTCYRSYLVVLGVL